jgi:hypothetical protein
MNSVPEWFTVEPDALCKYVLENSDTGSTQIVSGKSLSEGLPVCLEAGKPLRLLVSLLEPAD